MHPLRLIGHATRGFATILLLHIAAPEQVIAQTEPKTLKFEGAPSQTGTGALRCVANETAQLGLRALDENLNRTLVHEYAPQARSTNESVVVARVTDNAASTVNVLCVGDGEAWITVEAAGLRADMPVLVGTARRKASPKGPHPELASGASTTNIGAAPVQDVAPAPAAVPSPPVVASTPPTTAASGPTAVVTGTTTPVTRAGTIPTGGRRATEPSAPAGPLNAPAAPVQGEVGAPLVTPRTITAPELAVTGTAIQVMTRSFTSPELAITGTAIQSLSRSFTTSPLEVAGTAIQVLNRSITTPPLVIQGQ